jgi:hypothetical protein
VVEAAVDMAGALVEGAHTSAVAAFMEAALVVAVFATEAFAAVDFAAAAFAMAFAAIGLPSLEGLTIPSFTIPTHTTGTIPMAIILTGTVMDTLAFAAVDFAAAAFAMAFAAVADPYNQPVYQGSARDTPTSWLDKFSSVWLAQAINYGSIDGVSVMERGGRSANTSAFTVCQRMARSANNWPHY